tara:strand:+ start:333 stop:596 length:264 start_codon:yes stop_codon:yes gene_type:complete
MKIFFYKALLVGFIFFVVFKLTFGSMISTFERKIYDLSSKENIEMVKEKIREEIKVAIEKDEFISKEDANLINNFFNKIRSDLNKQN